MVTTEREQQAAERVMVENVRKRAREAKADIRRQCPAGYALDQAHAMYMLTDLAAVARSRILQRTFLVRAMVAHGWIAADVGAAFGLDVAQVQRELTREIWWRPTRAMLEIYPADVRVALEELGIHGES